MDYKLLALTVACFVGAVVGDMTVTIGDRVITVTDAGNVKLSFKDNDTYAITHMVSSVQEIDDAGAAIGTVGTQIRSFTDLSSNTFTMTEVTDGTYENLATKQFSMSTELVIDSANNVKAKLKVEFIVFNANSTGKDKVDGVYIYAGDVKMCVKVESWPFCDPAAVTCEKDGANLTGVAINVGVKVSGNQDATLKPMTTMTYMLGARTSVTVSNQVDIDGSTTSMTTGYPKLTTANNDDVFTSQLTTFTTSGSYCMITSLGRFDTFFDKVELKVLGNSGKMEYRYKGKQGDTEKIVMEFKNLIEKDEDGNKITDQGHGVNTFASESFTISNHVDAELQGIAVRRTTMEATLKGSNAEMKCNIYMFMDDGKITNGPEEYEMRAGAMKWDIDIQGWKFCGDQGTNCKQNKVGKYLDFDVIIKGKGDATLKNDTSTGGKEYDLGYGKLVLAKTVKVDGTDTNMAQGYPMFDQTGNKQTFTFRFPKFTNSLFYDPTNTMNTEEQGGDGSSAGNSIIATLTVLVISLVMARWL